MHTFWRTSPMPPISPMSTSPTVSTPQPAPTPQPGPRLPHSVRAVPAPLRAFLAILIGLWLLSFAYAELLWLLRHSWYGFDWMYLAGPGFDFFDYLPRMDYLHQSDFFTADGYRWYYPAPAALVYALFYAVVNVWDDWVAGYLVYIAVAVAATFFAAFRLARAIELRGVRRRSAIVFVAAAAILSWPLYFAIERGNIEAVTWFLFAAGVWALARERWMVAAVLLGAAASVKIYPGLMFAVFLRPRRWKEIGVGLLTTAAVTLASLRFLNPDLLLAWNGVREGVGAWTHDYAAGFDLSRLPYDHSAFELLKVLTLAHHPPYDVFLRQYMVVAAAVTLALFFGRVIRLPRVNQVLFVTVASVLLPPASFDYTLVNLYVPFAWLVLIALTGPDRGPAPRHLTPVMVLFGLLLGPETFLGWPPFSAAGLLKSICLLALLVFAVVVPLGVPGQTLAAAPGEPAATPA